MKRVAVFLVFVAFICCSSGTALAGAAADFFALSRELELSSSQTPEPSGTTAGSLALREQEVTARLLASPEELETVITHADTIEPGLLARLIERLKFEITQENRTALQSSCQALQSALQSGFGVDDRGKKKIANIYGREVDLLDGEWNTAPDGRRFWTSNEYPDIVLTPAEYRRYMATAVVVED